MSPRTVLAYMILSVAVLLQGCAYAYSEHREPVQKVTPGSIASVLSPWQFPALVAVPVEAARLPARTEAAEGCGANDAHNRATVSAVASRGGGQTKTSTRSGRTA